jgi:hypothetical protein
MAKTDPAATQSSNFDLKNELVELLPAGDRRGRAVPTTAELEALRVDRSAVPASKHGLETICGASCETGAQ